MVVKSMPSAAACLSGRMNFESSNLVDIQSQPHPIHLIFETPTHEYATIAIWSGAD